jgi:hypothetical protein
MEAYRGVEKGHEHPVSIRDIFDHQRMFNEQIWTPVRAPITMEQAPAEMPRFMTRLKDLSMGMVEETLEMLRTFEWRPHRRRKGKLQNVDHTHEELVDMFKYWLSLADMSNFPIDRLEELYYAKSRVVQYRYQEEWMREIDRPCVVIDIDNVLADYITGMCAWAKDQTCVRMDPAIRLRYVHRLDDCIRNQSWIDGTTAGVSPADWKRIKHEFRSTGGHKHLPVFKDAKAFLEWCQQQGWLVVLITSRPVDEYPNIFTDTVTWLHDNHLPFDRLWWAQDKGMALDETYMLMRSLIRFAVDDDGKFVAQFNSRGIRTYWLRQNGEFDPAHPLTVRSLTDIIEMENGDGIRRREA